MRKTTNYKRYRDGGAVPLHVQVDTPEAHAASDRVIDQMLAVIDKPQLAIDIDHGENIATIHADIERAQQSGDFQAQADAYRRLAKAERAMGRREGGRVDHGSPSGNPEDDASTAFQKQIDALRRSEQIQKDRNAELARERADLSVAREHAEHIRTIQEYINSYPDMVKHPQVLAAAADEVGRGDHGFPVHTLAFFDLVKANFENRMRNEPPEEPRPKRSRGGAVDDDEPSGKSYHERYREQFGENPPIVSDARERAAPGTYADRPGRVTLTHAMKEAARIAGISEKEYAEQVLRLREEKANGHYGGAP